MNSPVQTWSEADQVASLAESTVLEINSAMILVLQFIRTESFILFRSVQLRTSI